MPYPIKALVVICVDSPYALTGNYAKRKEVGLLGAVMDGKRNAGDVDKKGLTH